MAGIQTLRDYRDKVRRILSGTVPEKKFWSDELLDQALNMSYKYRSGQLIMSFEGYFKMIATIPLAVDEDMYNLPYGYQRVTKIEMVHPDERRTPLQRWERHEGTLTSPQNLGQGYVPNYRPVGNQIKLEPAPKGGDAAEQYLEFEDLPTVANNYVSSTDATVSQTKNIVDMGLAAVRMDKTGITEDTISVKKTSLTLSVVVGATIRLYIDSLDDIVSARLAIGGTSLTDSNTYSTIAEDLVQGWNTLTIKTAPDATTGAGATLTAVAEVQVAVTFSSITKRGKRFVVDNFMDPTSTRSLSIEYIGTPPELTDDDDALDSSFPSQYDELLVMDASMYLMDDNPTLDNGTIRSIKAMRAELDFSFQRFIDSRNVSRQEVEPFIGHYQDA